MSHDSSLEPILRAVEPALRLVYERHLRQILHFLNDRGRQLPTNTDLPFWLTRGEVGAGEPERQVGVGREQAPAVDEEVQNLPQVPLVNEP